MTRIDDYELIGKLGEGGMGAVYKARQISLDRHVALKVLAPKLATNPDFVTRFLREARATAKLNHPNIVAGIGVGSAGGYHFFAMEFIEGETFKRRVEAKTRMSEAEVLRIGAAVGSALAHAHAMGIVHRDVKPDNILIARDGTPKLADLGLAKASNQEDNSLTQSGMAVGTPHYIAPEQASGEQEIDGRADTYALGCTLYHAATGTTPFQANTSAAVMVKHINERMPHPQSLRPDLSDGFCLILSRMVARDRNDRYPKLDEAVADMEAVLAGEQPACRPLPPAKSRFVMESSRAQGVPPLAGRRERGETRRHAPVEVMAEGRRERGETRRHAPVEGMPEGRESRRRIVPQKKQAPWLLPAAGAGVVLAGALIFAFSGGSSKAAPEKTLASISDPPKPLPVSAPSTPPPPPLRRPEIPAPLPSLPQVETHTAPQREERQPRSESAPQPVNSQRVAVEPPPVGNAISLFDGKSLDGWSVKSPEWTVESGALVGRGDNQNAQIWKFNCLPNEFDLSFNGEETSGFHFGFTLHDAAILVQHYDGSLKLVRYVDSATDLIPPVSLATGKHAWRVILHKDALQLYVDGAKLAQIKVAQDFNREKRDFCIYAPPNGPVRVMNLVWRDPASAPTAPAESAKIATPEKNADAAEIRNQSEAQAAYAGFADEYLALLRKLDGKGAAALLEHAEKMAVLAPLSAQLKQDRQLLELLNNVLAAESDGAQKLTEADDFELGMGRGQPQHVGKKSPLHVSKIEKGAIVLDGGGVTLQTQFTQLNAETRLKLMGMGLLADAAPARAFLGLLALKSPPDAKAVAAIRAQIEAMRKGSPRPETDCIERWLQLVEDGALNAAAAATWPKVKTLAGQQQWKALQQALGDFTRTYQKSRFYESKRAELEALKQAADEGEAAALPPEEILKHFTEKLKAANPDFNGQISPKIVNGKLVELQVGARGLKDLTPCRGVPGLKSLEIVHLEGEHAQLSDLSPLKGLPLTHLEVPYSNVSDLSPLAGMPLTNLNIHTTPVASLAPLKGMPLDQLIMAGTRVSDLSPLQGLPLKDLVCYGCELLSDLGPLKGVPLESLNCSWNKGIRDVTPLQNLPLKSLYTDHIGTTDLSSLHNLKLTSIRLSYAPGAHDALLRDMTTLEEINGRSANDFRVSAANGTLPKE